MPLGSITRSSSKFSFDVLLKIDYFGDCLPLTFLDDMSILFPIIPSFIFMFGVVNSLSSGSSLMLKLDYYALNSEYFCSSRSTLGFELVSFSIWLLYYKYMFSSFWVSLLSTLATDFLLLKYLCLSYLLVCSSWNGFYLGIIFWIPSKC